MNKTDLAARCRLIREQCATLRQLCEQAHRSDRGATQDAIYRDFGVRSYPVALALAHDVPEALDALENMQCPAAAEAVAIAGRIATALVNGHGHEQRRAELAVQAIGAARVLAALQGWLAGDSTDQAVEIGTMAVEIGTT